MSLLTDASTTLTPTAPADEPLTNAPSSDHRSGAYPAGTRVEVHSRFDDSWSKGFEVAEVTADGYHIRRSSDGEVLPVEFSASEVRKERRRSNWWV